MSEGFDPYHKWLGIPPNQQPPNHYRLLGVQDFEDDSVVISNAADQRMAHVKSFQSGKSASHSQKILNELASARTCLLDATRKSAYDAELRNQPSPKKPPRPGAAHAESSSVIDALEEGPAGRFSSSDMAGESSPEVGTGIRISSKHKVKRSFRINLLGHVIAPILGLGLGVLALRSCTSEDSGTPVLPRGQTVAENPQQNGVGANRSKEQDPEPNSPDRTPKEQDDTSNPHAQTTVPNEKTKDIPTDKTPKPTPPAPRELLQKAVSTGNVKEVFSLFARHSELHGGDLAAEKLDVLEQLYKQNSSPDAEHAAVAAKEAIALIGADNLSRPQEFLIRSMKIVGKFTSSAKDKDVNRKAQEHLTNLKDHFVARHDLSHAIDVSYELAKLRDENADGNSVILEFLERIKGQAEEPQQFEALAVFSADLLKKAPDCEELEFLKKCQAIAIFAARKHFNLTGSNDVLNPVTLTILDSKDRCG